MVCYYCGSTGYKIKECIVIEPICFLCLKSGVEAWEHLAGSRPCKSFQEALATVKTLEKNEKEKRWSVLQGDLNTSRTAHHLLPQLCFEKKAVIVLISEQFQDRAGVGWFADELGTAAIWMSDHRLINVSDQGSGRCYVWVRHNSATYVSVYLTPNDRIDDFQIKLDVLENALREMQGDLIVAGDLNAKALDWGEARPDSRGRRIMEVASRLELSVLNTGSTSTFRRPGYRETIPDVSLTNEHLVARFAGWQVIEDYTGCDHQYILFDVHDRRPAVTSVKRHPGGTLQESSLSPPAEAMLISAATHADHLNACAITVPKNGTRRQRRPVYWWTNEIADLHYQAAKKALKRTIKASQRRCWKELCQDVDQNPWGLVYVIVTRKLGTNSQGTPQDARTLDHIVHTLIPPQPKREISLDAPGLSYVPQFTEEELLRAVSSMRNKKAPGPDRLPAEIIKVVAQSHPELLLNIKGKGPVGAASSYRPICMLDTAGKLLEKLIRPRLRAAVKAVGDLAGRQYVFRSGLSTIHAVLEVVTAAKMMERGNHRTRPLCLLATLDVRNAFNSVRWDLAREAIERNFDVAKYLLRIIDDYLNERFLVYDTSDGPRSLELTAGAAQGSILGPVIWNIFYDGIFRMAVPKGTFLRHEGGTVAAQPGHAESYLLDGRPRAISSSPEDRDRANYEEAHQHLAQLHCRRCGGPD
ncbi:uncharacterized protein LOC118449627 [Vespa mandarinia]|uniref:uncharacterized protein LOC118449627 n=1 Tax=Vespa mandarinia TaxID=7446 RepID=UPI00160AD61B|nr:uncharacterized protein LOC118449627 [Vespa mandarinia]